MAMAISFDVDDLAVTRTLLSRMVEVITSTDDALPELPEVELADLADEVRQTRVWTLSL
jgi:hypothetical protein